MMHSWDSYMSCYPFARDPRFKFLAFNMTLRRRTLELSNVFSRQLPRHTTREQVLWQLGQDNDFTIKKLMHGPDGTHQGDTPAHHCPAQSHDVLGAQRVG